MKIKLSLALLTILTLTFSSFKKSKTALELFNTYFEKSSLRVDYLLAGNAGTETFILKQLKKEDNWAGPLKLADKTPYDFGNYRFCVFDSASEILIYTKGFSSLFQEWQTTPEAKTTVQGYYHVNMMPFPKHTIRYTLEKRNYSDGQFSLIKEMYINPSNYFIIHEKPLSYPITTIQKNGDPESHIDIAFLAEGYTQQEMQKFRDDVKRVWDYISSVPPFDKNKDKFNIYALESPSAESGTDIPGKHIYRNTIFNSTFYTFNTDRYLTTSDIKSLHDVAAEVPYDQIFMLINSSKYGGGGFYNFYTGGTADHELSLKVAVHEFGHGFAGLADEYYNSEVAYDGFYNLKVEPWEPNITTLVNFESKWKNMLSSGTEIPTPRTEIYKDSIGVFEGGGYASQGIYSPFQDCRMKSNIPEGFCPVCSRAIQQVIDYYCEK